jgi:transcription termination/antitermination protein NusG
MSDSQDGRWYLVHTSSSVETKVKANLEQRVKIMGMSEEVFEVLVPEEETEVETPKGKKKTVKKQIYPGYVLVRMILNDRSWAMVRNTPGITGFVGQAKHPTPLSEKEVESILYQMGMGSAAPVSYSTFNVGQSVKIMDGPFSDFIGNIEEVNLEKKKLRVMVHIFGRETPVELGFSEVEEA